MHLIANLALSFLAAATPIAPADETEGLNGPNDGMTFGPDGHSYVPSSNSKQVLRYAGTSGANRGVVVDQSDGGLRNPRRLLFLLDGELWMSSWGSNSILAIDSNGSFRCAGSAASPSGPSGRYLYATSDQCDRVLAYNWLTGTRLKTLIQPGRDGLDAATFLALIRPRR